ncbi:MAG: transaldolase family protein [Lentisphaerota bacterium]
MRKKNLGVFLNSEDFATIEELMACYELEGITTNHGMIANLGNVDFPQYLRDMRKLIGDKAFLTQVTSSDPGKMLEEAELIRKYGGDNTFVKFPCSKEGFRAMRIFTGHGGEAVGTLCFSVIQGVFALLAGASYVAPFYSPMNDAGTDGLAVIRQLSVFIKRSGCKGSILSAGCRTSVEMGDIYEAGGDAVTVNPEFFKEELAPGLDKYQNKFASSWTAAHPNGATLLDLVKVP